MRTRRWSRGHSPASPAPSWCAPLPPLHTAVAPARFATSVERFAGDYPCCFRAGCRPPQPRRFRAGPRPPFPCCLPPATLRCPPLPPCCGLVLPHSASPRDDRDHAGAAGDLDVVAPVGRVVAGALQPHVAAHRAEGLLVEDELGVPDLQMHARRLVCEALQHHLISLTPQAA